MPKKFSKPHLSRIINGDIDTPEAPDKPQTIRFDIALQTQYPEYNRSTLKKYIKAGQVTRNGEVLTKPSTQITDTDKLKIQLQPEVAPPQPPIIYEDDNVIVLDKPIGLLTVSKGAFNPEPTLEAHGKAVHRLDRDTSGVIIMAKNDRTKSQLQKQFQDRKTHKTYYAVVVGHPKLDQAVINVPLARNLKAPTTFQPDKEGREAITQYQVVKQNHNYSLLALKPQTGRTHQLRVHLAHIGTPILGDKIYGQTPADRMYLHATELEITIPQGQRKTFRSQLPQEFRDVLKKS